jgi:hypothetical protein
MRGPQWEHVISLTPVLSRWERSHALSFGLAGTSQRFERGLTGSLAQRERAGVRENGHANSSGLPET